MTNPKYMRPGRDFAIGKLVEELGELQAALGKMLRWGPDSYNPELPPEQRETNSDWVEREIEDVLGAISNYRASVRAAAMSGLIAGGADMYDTPSARITGDKDRENPVEGAQPAPSDDLVEWVAMVTGRPLSAELRQVFEPYVGEIKGLVVLPDGVKVDTESGVSVLFAPVFVGGV